jgi:hypothetical protein
MSISTLRSPVLATPFVGELVGLGDQVLSLVAAIGSLIQEFRAAPPTPARTDRFEKDLATLLQQLGREIVAWVYNHLECSEAEPAVDPLGYDGEWYRRRTLTKNRHGIATLFGTIALWRVRYEPLEAGLPCQFPLEIGLGITAGRATPALAERVGQWAAQHTQQNVLTLLGHEHNVHWSVETLRKVTAAVSAGLAPLRHAAQVRQVLDWLGQAQASRGPHRPVLTAGRDGVFVPLSVDREYHEAGTGTLAVLDRRGRRLGTVYLGSMPEPGQGTLSEQMRVLLRDVLAGWHGPCPRLEYVTDGGHHPSEFYNDVLRKMRHPRTGKALDWQWVIDFYHACGYVSKLAAALFGAGSSMAARWAHKMRHWLQHRRHGIYRVLHSAAAQRQIWELSVEEEKAYQSAYNYLRQRMDFMDYAGYRQQGLAIGSGVTEAACKRLFTQRFKQSGMQWSLEGGQVIVDVRVVWLSGVWHVVYQAYLEQLPQPYRGTKRQLIEELAQNAA